MFMNENWIHPNKEKHEQARLVMNQYTECRQEIKRLSNQVTELPEDSPNF